MSSRPICEGCGGCRFWDRQEPTPGDEISYGLCRRYPPGDTGWPGTCGDDWCGEQIARDVSISA